MPECIAVLGGSFDPLHKGHWALAEAALEQLNASRVLFMPCAVPPHKPGLFANNEARAALVQAAIDAAAESRIKLDTREYRRRGHSYSLFSLQELRKEYGKKASISFVIGWDSLQNLDTWYRWLDLFELSHLLVAARPGYSEQLNSSAVSEQYQKRKAHVSALSAKPSGLIAKLDMAPWPISSTELRQLLGQTQDEELLLDYISPEVLALIRSLGLYRSV